MIDVRPLSRRKDGTLNIEIITRTKSFKNRPIERAKRDDSNDAIYVLIGLVVIKLLSEV